ncbi:phage tail protein [Pseudoalteromonas sp. PS5]|uniref:phage tail-collar fiber domain-containing protein n=1 Tax=Pseudoalteromonas sp. PS5 TaxID=1437473 RepID=UPI000FFF4FDD|nr:phage tail protein [Pseudoalteromonas sp. PS5]RXE99600.1 hypothetical protein D9603_16435 [Pseudoalteromonas sp. PS5]
MQSSHFAPVVWTTQGLAKLTEAIEQGQPFTLTHLSAGSSGYRPSEGQTQLQQQQQKVPILQAEQLTTTQVRFSAVFEGEAEYPVKELGVWSDNTLVAVHSANGEVLNHKSKDVAWLEIISLNLAALPSQQVSFATGVLNTNIFMAKELATSVYAHLRQGKSLIQQANQTLQLAMRLRKANIG